MNKVNERVKPLGYKFLKPIVFSVWSMNTILKKTENHTQASGFYF